VNTTRDRHRDARSESRPAFLLQTEESFDKFTGRFDFHKLAFVDDPYVGSIVLFASCVAPCMATNLELSEGWELLPGRAAEETVSEMDAVSLGVFMPN
jgi:hypothetical protein